MSADRTQAKTLSGGARVLLRIDEDVSIDQDAPNDYDAHWQLYVVDRGWIVQPKHSIFVGSESAVGDADVDSLREAMLDERRCCGQLPDSPEPLAIALDDGENFHPESSPRDTVHLLVDSTDVKACTEVIVRREPEWTSSALQDLLKPAVGMAYSYVRCPALRLASGWRRSLAWR